MCSVGACGVEFTAGNPLCSVLCVICYDLWSLDALLFFVFTTWLFDMVMVFPIQLISFDLYVIDHFFVHDVRLVHFSMLAVLSWVSEIPQIAAVTLSILLQIIPDLFPLRFFSFLFRTPAVPLLQLELPRPDRGNKREVWKNRQNHQSYRTPRANSDR